MSADSMPPRCGPEGARSITALLCRLHQEIDRRRSACWMGRGHFAESLPTAVDFCEIVSLSSIMEVRSFPASTGNSQ